MDLVSRMRLVETIERQDRLRFEYVAEELSEKQRASLLELLRAETVGINWGQSLANMFLGYNTCLCGDGDGIEDGWGNLLFTAKHGDELYIRGFLSFQATRHVVWDIDS